jgi:hypothetical protein
VSFMATSVPDLVQMVARPAAATDHPGPEDASDRTVILAENIRHMAVVWSSVEVASGLLVPAGAHRSGRSVLTATFPPSGIWSGCDRSPGHPPRRLRDRIRLSRGRDVQTGMVLRGEAVSDLLLIAILVAAFALVTALVQLISRMIERDTDLDDLANEPPDTGTPDGGSLGNGVVGPSGWRL